ncbi:exodeoxyribonuclease VII large subunit [Alsobacter sp. SYSU M60028]|uniref:Exodeoxyribonuclease 7 large subunit n=1 Tax=Alsobacter ponti TaxID=2962936 RepID=A0ABT1LCJ7_9HYPH|nr:exodeoxyribonuclease VII large subunit [Alsobacter ponti]MCP8939222.1 exodeoxyribonuclease VII large subunit [Alsobacter ponti]
MSDTALVNAPEWTVSELSGALRRTLEDAYGHVRVRAELGAVKVHSSGHVYLDLKDEKACLAGVMWRTTAAKMRFRPEMGMEVIATGRITTYPGQSKYQLIVESLEPAGVGALLAQLEERRKRLAAEGLFDAARKKPLPFLPGVIGVVTSPTGAVIRDILHRLADRFPRHVVVWPVRVQGETCAAEVAAAIRGFNALPADGPIPRPDLLIVARGGGSLEDLWGFNEEAVVRAAAESAIPLISAVGHETDTTLIDHASDRRAPTPTGAAEIAVPVRGDLLAAVQSLGARLVAGELRLLDRNRADLRSAVRALPHAEDLLAAPRQRLDLAAGRLPGALLVNSRRHEARLLEAARRLARLSPEARLAGLRARIDGLGSRLVASREALLRAETLRVAQRRERLASVAARAGMAMAGLLERRRTRLGAVWQLAESYSYRGVLARGFALVHAADGTPLRDAAAIAPGAVLDIEFHDGKVRAVAGEGGKPRPARPKAGGGPSGQGSLFGS